jgi:hypothetical protein
MWLNLFPMSTTCPDTEYSSLEMGMLHVQLTEPLIYAYLWTDLLQKLYALHWKARNLNVPSIVFCMLSEGMQHGNIISYFKAFIAKWTLCN